MKLGRNTLRRAVALALALAVFLVLPAGAAASTFTVSQSLPIDLLVYVPCANGGSGEFVELTGSLHDLYTITLNSGGGFTFKYLDNPQGITGTGFTTGAKYQGTGETGGGGTGRVGSQETYVNNFKIIGQGSGNNFLVHENFHVTVNANGTLTAYVDNFSVVCQ